MPSVKPGVSAKAEIIVTNIPDALSVPIQAITSYKGKPAVYQVTGSKSEPRPVEVGMFNTKFIEIVKGLEPGDRVMLAPPFNSQEKDLEGAVLTAEEKAKLTATARKPIPHRRTNLVLPRQHLARWEPPQAGEDRVRTARGPWKIAHLPRASA